LHTKHKPIFITKNDYGNLVVVSIETYKTMINNMSIALGRNEDKLNGKTIDVKDVLFSLNRKYIE